MTDPVTFVPRNIKIKAVRWTGENQYAIMRFVGDTRKLLEVGDPVVALRYNYMPPDKAEFRGGILRILTHEGRKEIGIGDYVVRIPFIGLDVKRKEIFEKMFKEHDDETQ